MIGADLTSKGGIASVIRNYYLENLKSDNKIKIFLLKTNYYKDKNILAEIMIFFKSFFNACILMRRMHIIHIHSSSGPSFIRKSLFLILSKILNKKVIFHIHSSNFDDFFFNRNTLLNFYIHKILHLSDLVLTLCSDWEIKLRKTFSGINIKTIHNPIIISDFSHSKTQKLNGKNFQILFLGFLVPSKGIFDIFEIIKFFLKNSEINIQFIIAGKGDLENYVIDSIKKYKLNKIVKYVGWVSGVEKQKLLENSDILLLPSYNEGMPICILEAMSYSLPIISTKIAGIPDLVSNDFNGYLFEPGQIEQFYQALLNLYKNRQLVLRLGRNSYKKVQSFSTDKIFKKLIRIYLEIL